MTGIYELLTFDNLIDSATSLEIGTSNCYFIAKTLWHSLWTNPNTDSSGERSQIVEIFYLLGKKDEKIYSWLIDSISEALVTGVSYKVSVDIIKVLAKSISSDNEVKLDLTEKILAIFNCFLESSVDNVDLEMKIVVLDGLGVFLEQLARNKEAYEMVNLDKIIELVLKSVSERNYEKEVVQRFSFIFKIYSSK